MTHQSGTYGTQDKPGATLTEQAAQGATMAVNKTTEFASEALDQADEWLKPVGLSLKEKPGTVLAVVGGLAFAAGALWMLRSSRHQSQTAAWMSELSNYARRFR
jgi:hypothetical protein